MLIYTCSNSLMLSLKIKVTRAMPTWPSPAEWVCLLEVWSRAE
jgi:hypothetical protein